MNAIYKIGYYHLIIGLIVCTSIQNYPNVIRVFNSFSFGAQQNVCLFTLSKKYNIDCVTPRSRRFKADLTDSYFVKENAGYIVYAEQR